MLEELLHNGHHATGAKPHQSPQHLLGQLPIATHQGSFGQFQGLLFESGQPVGVDALEQRHPTDQLGVETFGPGGGLGRGGN